MLIYKNAKNEKKQRTILEGKNLTLLPKAIKIRQKLIICEKHIEKMQLLVLNFYIGSKQILLKMQAMERDN